MEIKEKDIAKYILANNNLIKSPFPKIETKL